jgi:hypothetical protein
MAGGRIMRGSGVLKRTMSAVLALALAVAPWTLAPTAAAQSILYAAQQGGRYDVVDCLIPGQIRRIGRITKTSPRKMMRIPRFECENRNGAYTEDSLGAWIADAETHDDVRSLRTAGLLLLEGKERPADPAAAAQWLQRAADKGDAPAKHVLAQLYEQGVGVPRDLVRAERLKHEAAGFTGPQFINVRFTGPDPNEVSRIREDMRAKDAEIARLQSELARLNLQLGAKEKEQAQLVATLSREKGEAGALRADLERERQALAKDRAAAAAAAEAARRAEAEAAAAKRSLAEAVARAAAQSDSETRRLAEVAAEQQRRAEAAAAEAARARMAEEGRARVAALEAEQKRREAEARTQAEKLAAEIARKDDEVRKAREAQRAAEEAAAIRQAALEKERAALAQREAAIGEKQTRMVAKEESVRQNEGDLAQMRQEMQAQRALIEQLLASGPAAGPGASERIVVAQGAAPEIRLIRPEQPPLTRSEMVVIAEGAGSRQLLTVRAVGSAAIRTVTVNGEPVTTLDVKTPMDVAFSREVPLHPNGTRIKISVVDAERRTGELEFVLKPNPAMMAVAAPTVDASQLRLGKFHALLIANQNYKNGWPSLKTPIRDVDRLAAILDKRYGMHVTKLVDATSEEIAKALWAYRSAAPEDSLLIYYAGHGQISADRRSGFWIGVDGDQQAEIDWYDNNKLERAIGQLPVRKVLVVSDSCFSESMGAGQVPSLPLSANAADQTQFLTHFAALNSRVFLSSGGVAPVLDGGGGLNSVFAGKLIDFLDSQTRPFTTFEMHREIAPLVTRATTAAPNVIPQTPQLRTIGGASSNEGGDFIFLPRRI